MARPSAFGRAHLFYPEADDERCTMALLIDVDPAGKRIISTRLHHTVKLHAKRSLALREFALGVEGLERFVRREPLRRVHECVFGVLALESEPVDPRL